MNHAVVTGGAGFIGSHLVDSLLAEGWRVTVIDNFDDFYDPAVKRVNVMRHREYASYHLMEADIRKADQLQCLADLPAVDVMVHLAARAGVRPSIDNPVLYQEVNVAATQNLLEFCRTQGIPQFVFASSSSVYGVNENAPWREDCTPLPISPYASTKLSGEFLGHVYSHLYNIRFIALRFFTVYGPRQRPDLAIHKFARLMLEDKPIPFFGDGSTSRDYTYIADIVRGVRAAMSLPRSFEIINLGNNRAVSLHEMVNTLADCLGVAPRLQRLPPQAGDVPLTRADISKAERLLGYAVSTRFDEGIRAFVHWLLNTDPLLSRGLRLPPTEALQQGNHVTV